MARKPCRTCWTARATRRGECDACAAYRRKHGKARPEELIVRAVRRQIEAELASR